MPKEEGPKSFAVILGEMEHGELNAAISEQFQELVRKLARHAETFNKAKGKFTLSLDVNVDAGGLVHLESDVKTKEPKVVRQRSVFWLSPGGNLLTKDPKQLELPVRAVPAPSTVERGVPVEERETRGV